LYVFRFIYYFSFILCLLILASTDQ
jgi:hypothetical protein